MKNLKKFLACIAILAITATAYAQYGSGYEFFRGFLHSTILTVDETATITTVNSTTVAATNVTVATSFTNSGSYIAPFDTVSLTSPTVTFSAAGIGIAQITTDVTQTGLTITGGTIGQTLKILGTNDSATIQLTDGTSSMTLTGNLTLGLGDIATLMCTSTDGDEWSEESSAAN